MMIYRALICWFFVHLFTLIYLIYFWRFYLFLYFFFLEAGVPYKNKFRNLSLDSDWQQIFSGLQMLVRILADPKSAEAWDIWILPLIPNPSDYCPPYTTVTNFTLYIYIYIYIYIIYIYIYRNLPTTVEGNPKAPFSITTVLRCRGECFSFPWNAPLTPYPYLIILSV